MKREELLKEISKSTRRLEDQMRRYGVYEITHIVEKGVDTVRIWDGANNGKFRLAESLAALEAADISEMDIKDRGRAFWDALVLV